jgi:Tfp pilus assembly protein PilF
VALKAELLAALNREEDAVRAFEELVSRQPSVADAWIAFSAFHERRRRPEQAQVVLRSGVDKSGGRAVREAAIRLDLRLGKIDEANLAAAALAGRSSDPDAALALGRLFFEAGQFDTARRWARLVQSTTSPARQRAARLFLAEIDRTEGETTGDTEKLSAAARQYEAILQAEPANLGVANNLAWVYARHLRAPDRALPLVARIRQMVHDEELPRSVLETVVLVYRSSKQTDGARKVVEAALRGDPDSPGLHLLLAGLEAEAGRLEAARVTLARARDLGASTSETAPIEAAINRSAEP